MSYIDRDKLLKNARTWVDGSTLVMAVKDIYNAPEESVVLVTKANWFEYVDSKGDTPCSSYLCSHCGWDDNEDDKYCSHCGARMD